MITSIVYILIGLILCFVLYIAFKAINTGMEAKKNNKILDIFSKTIKIIGKKLKNLNPDLFVVLGDRYETLASVISANISRIPIAHISGGEVTQGALDDSFRHAITKLSNIHFAANKVYKRRIVQLGENKKNIFIVGGSGVENINSFKFRTKDKLEKILKINFLKRNLMVTLHPETINQENNKKIINSLFPILESLKNTLIIFTAPNIDPGSEMIEKKILKAVKKNKNFKYFKNLGKINYFSCVKMCDAVIGNSSSGITEVPSLKKVSINIGERQKGRMLAKSVINVNISKKDIRNSISKIYKRNIKKILKNSKNPYFKKNTSKNIVKILQKINLKNKY